MNLEELVKEAVREVLEVESRGSVTWDDIKEDAEAIKSAADSIVNLIGDEQSEETREKYGDIVKQFDAIKSIAERWITF